MCAHLGVCVKVEQHPLLPFAPRVERVAELLVPNRELPIPARSIAGRRCHAAWPLQEFIRRYVLLDSTPCKVVVPLWIGTLPRHERDVRHQRAVPKRSSQVHRSREEYCVSMHKKRLAGLPRTGPIRLKLTVPRPAAGVSRSLRKRGGTCPSEVYEG